MKEISVNLFFSSPEGKVPLDQEDLSRPFLLNPLETHPFMTIGDYFKAIQEFVLKDSGSALHKVLASRSCGSTAYEDIIEMRIISEAHGAFYHLASVEVLTRGRPVKLSVSTALSDEGKACLEHEFNLLCSLNETRHLPYLPKPYFLGKAVCKTEEKEETLVLFLGEWFDGYHEWHLWENEKNKETGILIWDTSGGNRLASNKQCYQILKQSAKILTLYYDTRDSSQIYPWHHAAGDFIVKPGNGHADIRLTTVRHYGPLIEMPDVEQTTRIGAIIHFFLNLTVRMRLDRINGIGRMAWIDDFSVASVIEGFFEGLKTMEAEGWYDLGNVSDLLQLLKSFTPDEISLLFTPLLELYRQEDAEDYSIIHTRLDGHIHTLHQTLKEFNIGVR